MNVDCRYEATDRGIRSTGRKICSSATVSSTSLTSIDWGRTWTCVVDAVDQMPEPWQFVREICDFQKGVDDDQVLSGMTPY